MGAAGSKLEKALGDQFPEGERYFVLENFSNTRHSNSVLQMHVGAGHITLAEMDACLGHLPTGYKPRPLMFN